MDDQDYIRKAVELADGWELTPLEVIILPPINRCRRYTGIEHPEQPVLGALAAQLRGQAQANPHIVFKISVVDSASFVEMLIYNPNGDEEADPLRFVANETDEAMAFFKVIVESTVLQRQEPHD